ncbi:hypothetical protein ABPG74_006897 [Tetrahymena malaccensis]
MSLEETNKILFVIKEEKGESTSLIEDENIIMKQSCQSLTEIDNPIKDLECCQSQESLMKNQDGNYQILKIDKSAQTSNQPRQLTSSSSNLIIKKTSSNQGSPEQTQIYCSEKQQVSQNIFTNVLNIIKQYTKSCINLFIWQREYLSFGEYSFQFIFDGISVYFLNKQAKKFKGQYNQCLVEEQQRKKDLEEVSQDTKSLFIRAKIGENVLVKGKITNQLAKEQIENIDKINQTQKKISSIFTIYGYSLSNLYAQFDQNLSYKQHDLPLNQPYKINNLAKIIAVAFSRYIYKSKLSLENGSFDSQIFYYFYGKKDLLTNMNMGLKISSIFKEFNFLQIEIDQKALQLSILITYGISLYFAFKFVKNLFQAPKKVRKN